MGDRAAEQNELRDVDVQSVEHGAHSLMHLDQHGFVPCISDRSRQ